MYGAGQECRNTGHVCHGQMWVHGRKRVLVVAHPCHPKQLCKCIPSKRGKKESVKMRTPVQ